MSNELAMVKKDTVDVVSTRIKDFQEKRELQLPPNYSADNALKSAWLILQSTKDKNGKLALQVCDKNSIANSLLDMVVQGLSPAKKQCYFVVYSNQLQLVRSYFGTATAVQRVKSVSGAPLAQVVYEDDELEYEIQGANKVIIRHRQKLGNIDKTKIAAAYCTIPRVNDTSYTEIMTFEEIKQAWKQSRTKVFDDKGNLLSSSTHGKFAQEMAKKTVINRACKGIINTSDDSDILIEAFNRTTENEYKNDVQAEIEEEANKEELDFQDDVIETEYDDLKEDDYTGTPFENMPVDEGPGF